MSPFDMLQSVMSPPPPLHTHSGLVIAMVVSLIFIVLLRYLAGIMVWVMIVLVILVLGYGKYPNLLGDYRPLKKKKTLK